LELVHRQWPDTDGIGGNGVCGLVGLERGIADALESATDFTDQHGFLGRESKTIRGDP
jgi:hypothetical protein